MANDKHLAFALAGIVIILAISGIAFIKSENSITGSVTGIHEYQNSNSFYLQQERLVLIQSRTIIAQEEILQIVEVEQWFDENSFTALVPLGLIPKLKLYAEIRSYSEE